MAPKTQAQPRATTADGFRVYCTYDELADIATIKPNPRNPNKHPEAQIDLLARIITDKGWRANITVSRRSGLVVKGHGRLLAAQKAGCSQVPIEWQEYATDNDEINDLIADNRLAELAILDEREIADLLAQMEADEEGVDISLTGYTADQVKDIIEKAKKEQGEEEKVAARITLQQKFLISPFTVLDARSGVWLERKKAWKALGIRSEIGRGEDDDKTKSGLTYAKSSQPPAVYRAKNDYEAKLGQRISWDEFTRLFPDAMAQGGTSIFDPVLCEVAYRWFCPQGGAVIDPFAGGSVRGIVAALTGRKYTGVDLSERQVDANRENWSEITHESILGEEPETYPVPDPEWINGDSTHIDELAAGEYDLFFTCPPYADLEVYSDKPEDLSNKDYPEFLELYRAIIAKTAAMLKPDRFACIVVGDIRDAGGFYRNFISDTITAFQDAGMKFYNEAILVTSLGSLAIRAGKQFTNSRKLGKAHQNALVFCNGDPKKAAAASELLEARFAEDRQLTEEHQKILVFSKGDPEKASDAIGVPETAEELDAADNGALLRELLGADFPEEAE